jgi:hypothetical protein
LCVCAFSHHSTFECLNQFLWKLLRSISWHISPFQRRNS